jgi:hypothetical protein
MPAINIFYLSLVLVAMFGFGTVLAYYSQQS